MTQRDVNYIQMIQDAYRPNLMMQGNLPVNIDNTPLALPATATARYTFEPREIKARMDSPSVKVVLTMGFPRELVRQAIQAKLSASGDDFASAEELVGAVMQLQEQQEQGILEKLLPLSSSASFPAAAIRADAVRSEIVSSPVIPTTYPVHSSHLPPVPEVHSSPHLMSSDVGTGSVVETHLMSPGVSIDAATTAAGKKPNDDIPNNSATLERSGKGKKRNKKRKPKPNQGEVKEAVGGETAAVVEHDTDLKHEQFSTDKSATTAAAAAAAFDDSARSLMEENRQLKEAKTCKICMDEEVNIVFLPCGHLACCNSCAPALRNCPICRALIRGTVRIYLS
jgi:hypothetical protein